MRRAILVAVALTSLGSEQAGAIDGNALLENCELFDPHQIPRHVADALMAGYCNG